MNVMLTSFEIALADRQGSVGNGMFYRMPPVSMSYLNRAFLPDFELLLLCDRLFMDRQSFEQLVNRRRREYCIVADVIQMLHSKGYVQLIDYRSLLHENRELVELMVARDMAGADAWLAPLRDCLETWREFLHRIMSLAGDTAWSVRTSSPDGAPVDDQMTAQNALLMFHGANQLMCLLGEEAEYVGRIVEEALKYSTKRRKKEHREVLEQVLRTYLTYINSNIVLARLLGVPFHDWRDFLPFYEHKFLSVGQQSPEGELEIRECRRLFEVSFPEFAIRDAATLLKALEDPRITSLRRLVSDAVAGSVSFDADFARNVLRDVLMCERRATKYRTIVSYATSPVGLVPWIGTPVQKGIEETVGAVVGRRMREKYQWFYMLTELHEG